MNDSKILIFIIAFIVILCVSVLWDWYKIKKQKAVVDHFQNGLIRLAAFTLNASWPFYGTWDLVSWSQGILLQMVIFWIAFDLGINYVMGWKLTHLGTTALLDKIFPTWGYQFTVKIITLAAVAVWIIWI